MAQTEESVDLNSVIEDAIRMQASALESRGIITARELDPDLPKLLMDKNRVMQAIVNPIDFDYLQTVGMNKMVDVLE